MQQVDVSPKEVIAAFQQMTLAAASEEISLRIISGTRNFWEQKAIWEKMECQYSKIWRFREQCEGNIKIQQHAE